MDARRGRARGGSAARAGPPGRCAGRESEPRGCRLTHGVRAPLCGRVRASPQAVTDVLNPEPLLRALHDGGVRHIIIGGFAVNAHGVIRPSNDLHIVPDPDPDNLAPAPPLPPPP